MTLVASVLSLSVFFVPQAARAQDNPPPLINGCVTVPVIVNANVATDLSVIVGGIVDANAVATGVVSVATAETAKICVSLKTLALVTVSGLAIVNNCLVVTLHVQALLAPTTLDVKVTLTGPVSGSLDAAVHVAAYASANVLVFV